MHLATGSRAPADSPPAASGMTQCGRPHNTLRQAALAVSAQAPAQSIQVQAHAPQGT